MIAQNRMIVVACMVSLLAACGGGGGDSGTSSSPTTSSYNLASARQARLLTAFNDKFTISGSCSGSGSDAKGTPNPSSLYGSTYSTTIIETVNYSNCVGSYTLIQTGYLNAAYYTIAAVDLTSGTYLQATAVNDVPATVTAGTVIVLGTITQYSSPAKTTILSTSTDTLSVTADSANSVLVTYVTQTYNTSNVLIGTITTIYRLTSSGAYTPISQTYVLPSGYKEVRTFS